MYACRCVVVSVRAGPRWCGGGDPGDGVSGGGSGGVMVSGGCCLPDSVPLSLTPSLPSYRSPSPSFPLSLTYNCLH